jgi:hypothetical protein
MALLVDPALPPDRRDRGPCGRVGDLLNLTRMTNLCYSQWRFVVAQKIDLSSRAAES